MGGGRGHCIGCFRRGPSRIEKDWGDLERREEMEEGKS